MADVLAAGLGNNTVTGGAGIDTFIVTGTDHITDLGYGGADILKIMAGAIANANISNTWKASSATTNNGTVNITTAGFGVDLSAVTTGTSGYNVTDTGAGTTLKGSAMADVLIGGTGKNTLVGGLGNDTLTGGSGKNAFVFNTTPNSVNNVDTITNFKSGTDLLVFSKAIFPGVNTHTATGFRQVLNKSEFVSSANGISDTSPTSHFIYNNTTGGLYYDADANGAGAAVEVAIIGVSSHPALTFTDLNIIA